MSSKDLINWGELSRQLTGDRTYIRRGRIPKKYEKRIKRLLKIMEIWLSWSK
jgi:hypothetical protein